MKTQVDEPTAAVADNQELEYPRLMKSPDTGTIILASKIHPDGSFTGTAVVAGDHMGSPVGYMSSTFHEEFEDFKGRVTLEN
jgi:hypothetical protein